MHFRSLIAIIPLLLGLARASEAAVITVDTVAGPGCTLQSALAAAEYNRRVGTCARGEAHAIDEIRFAPLLAGTFALPAPTQITGSVRIVGRGPTRTTIDGMLVVQTPADGQFTLTGVTMRKGLLLWRAGEILVQGVRFAGLADEMLHGSAISTPMASIDRLAIVDSEFLHNPGSLGVVALSDTAQIREVTIRASRFVGNHTVGHGRGAGALYIGAATDQVSIENTDFVGNTSEQGAAGAIAVERPASLVIDGSVFDGNESPAAGAINAYRSVLDITNSSFTRNTGGDAGAVYLLGDGYFGLRFSSVVDNISANGAPALALDLGPGWVELLANVLRAPPYGRVCGWASLAWTAYNQEYLGQSCRFASSSDLAHLTFPLTSIQAGPGRPRVPIPWQHGPGRDRVTFQDCRRSDLEPLAVDIRGRERPWSNGFPDPYGWCDVGPVELRPDDLPAASWHPSIP